MEEMNMAFSLLSAANWPIVGQLCWLLGKVMNFIYTILDSALPGNNGLVGLSIILYTIFVYTLMIPLTIKQQRSQKMTSVMNPEIQAVQKKYRNKKDQASMMKQQEEIQQVYDKYGTSMMGGCLPLLVQMPLLLALYPVIYDIQGYVPAIKDAPASVNRFLTIPNLTVSPITMIKNSGDYGIAPALIIITAILLPVLSGATQYLSVKISQAISGQELDKDNPMASTMNTMNVTMPLFSVFMVFTLPTGIGLYWVVSAVVRIIQQVIINKHLAKISVDELIERNKEKAEKKRQKRGEKAERINAMAQANTRSIKDSANRSVSGMSEKEKESKIEQAKTNAENAKPGSLAAKANMVKKFNESN
ncbi:MAG: membrane protein insertase YidC [Dorea sp.]|jgi:YidC/Oxa1 family membrane protein insertase|nr:membrane protein insertase YidC [Dorea sp.]MCI9227609.1 membrane protein insertase YidC [Dorea sp.]